MRYADEGAEARSLLSVLMRFISLVAFGLGFVLMLNFRSHVVLVLRLVVHCHLPCITFSILELHDGLEQGQYLRRLAGQLPLLPCLPAID